MRTILRTLLSGMIDYAGLFPPAGLGMESAVNRYDSYRKGSHSWMLGRFVVPAAKLVEFEEAYAPLSEDPAGAWHLSILIGRDVEKDSQSITRFRSQLKESIVVDSVEIKADAPQAIAELPGRIPSGVTAYVEIPIANDPADLIEAIVAAGLNAKVRTGAITVEGFPQPAQLARFLALCGSRKVPFKATAGLHHPLRNTYRLTYEPNSASGLMYGFLNVFLAAAFAKRAMSESFLIELLEESSPDAFHFSADSVQYRNSVLTESALKECRHLAISVGSCSFEEPVADLRSLRLL